MDKITDKEIELMNKIIEGAIYYGYSTDEDELQKSKVKLEENINKWLEHNALNNKYVVVYNNDGFIAIEQK